MVGGVAASAAVRTWPFRVYSFPTEIQIASATEFPAWMYKWDNYLTPGLIIPLDDDGRKLQTQILRHRIVSNAAGIFSEERLAQANWT
jgi:hypothetical protein